MSSIEDRTEPLFSNDKHTYFKNFHYLRNQYKHKLKTYPT